jgi:hypothetical protein
MITDAWTCIDHLNRARKLVQRFSYGDPRPAEIDPFLDATKPSASIRNRIQHLDEDIFSGANCVEGNPVLGALSWACARTLGGHIRYSISSGPSIDGGSMGAAQITDVDHTGDVVDFRLMAADQTVCLDKMMKALADFMMVFEVTVNRAVISGLRDGAAQKGIPVETFYPHNTSDMTIAMRMRRKPEGGWECGNGDWFGIAEVGPGSFDMSGKPEEV